MRQADQAGNVFAMAADPVIAKALPALLRLAGSHPWREITLAMIADEAGLSLGDFHGHASREDLLEGLDGFFGQAHNTFKGHWAILCALRS